MKAKKSSPAVPPLGAPQVPPSAPKVQPGPAKVQDSDAFGGAPTKADLHAPGQAGQGQPVMGRGAAGAILLAQRQPAAGVRSAQQQLRPLLKTLWERRDDIAMQPHPGAAWLAISSKGPPARITVRPKEYVRGLLDVGRRRPEGSKTHSRMHKSIKALSEQVGHAAQGDVPWSRAARDTFYFDRSDVDLAQAKEQVFLQVPPEHLPALMAELVPKALDNNAQHTGVLRCEVASPFWPAPGNVVLSTTGGEDTERLLALVAKLHRSQPEWFGKETPPLTEPRLPGVSVGQIPPRDRYPDETFESLRAQVLHSVACEASEQDLSPKAFAKLFDSRWREAGLNPTAPHQHIDAVALDPEVVPLPGALKVQPGLLEVQVPGFEGKGEHTVQVQISDQVGAILGRRKGVRLLAEQGQFVRVDVDRTRNPPRERVMRQFSAAFVDDTRYRLDFGEVPPPFVHFDKPTQTYHIPSKITLVPPAKGRYGNYVIEVQTDPERAGRAKPMPSLLIDKLNDNNVQGDQLARVMRRIEGYVSNPEAHRTQRVVLEEGTNGVSVVALSNKAAGVWKPTAAEYPEQARVHLEPDHQARREALAYFISKNLGHLGRVPPTVYREIDGDSGAYCALSRGTLPGTHCARLDEVLADPKDPAYIDMAVFDCIIGNLDRHSGNILFGGGTVLAIDHGLAFPLEHGAQGEMNFLFSADVPLTADHKQQIAGMLAALPELREEAERLDIDPAAIDRMVERMQQMLQLGRTYSEWRT